MGLRFRTPPIFSNNVVSFYRPSFVVFDSPPLGSPSFLLCGLRIQLRPLDRRLQPFDLLALSSFRRSAAAQASSSLGPGSETLELSSSSKNNNNTHWGGKVEQRREETVSSKVLRGCGCALQCKKQAKAAPGMYRWFCWTAVRLQGVCTAVVESMDRPPIYPQTGNQG